MIQGNYEENGLLLEKEPEIMRDKLTDILVTVSWREIARTYFGKSASWLYHKLDGIRQREGTVQGRTVRSGRPYQKDSRKHIEVSGYLSPMFDTSRFRPRAQREPRHFIVVALTFK